MTSEAAVMWNSRLALLARLAQADPDPPQGAVVDVEHARPADRVRVDAERVAAEEVVVEERGARGCARRRPRGCRR